MENSLLHKQVKSQFEISKEGGKCKMCKKFYKGKLSNLKDHLLRKRKEKAGEIDFS
jgi:DNA phosphorothioation-dependent restriction protein DptG